MISTSAQPLLNFTLFDFYQLVYLRFCLVFGTFNYFLFFLNWFDLLSNACYYQKFVFLCMFLRQSHLHCFFFVLGLFILFGFLIVIILLKNLRSCFVTYSKMEFIKYRLFFFVLELKNYYYKLDMRKSMAYHNFLFLLFLVNYYMQFLNLL